MSFVYHFAILVLAQHQARHMVLLFDIPADNEIVVLHALDLHPVLGPFSLDIHAVLPFGNNALQLLLFREPVQCFSLSFDGFGDGQPLVLSDRFLQQRFPLLQGKQRHILAVQVQNVISYERRRVLLGRQFDAKSVAHQAAPLYLKKVRLSIL